MGGDRKGVRRGVVGKGLRGVGKGLMGGRKRVKEVGRKWVKGWW